MPLHPPRVCPVFLAIINWIKKNKKTIGIRKNSLTGSLSSYQWKWECLWTRSFVFLRRIHASSKTTTFWWGTLWFRTGGSTGVWRLRSVTRWWLKPRAKREWCLVSFSVQLHLLCPKLKTMAIPNSSSSFAWPM